MADAVGDAACWLHEVCEICGAVISGADSHRPGCERAPAMREGDVPREAAREVRQPFGCKKARRDSRG